MTTDTRHYIKVYHKVNGKGKIVLMCNIKEKTYNAKIGIK